MITVVKDDPSGLRNTLESVAEQIGENLNLVEFLVVDGSTPKLEQLLSELTVMNSHYFWQQPSGIFSAMNFGIAHASGEYLLFLNAGDTLVEQSTLSKLVEFLQYKSPIWAFGRVKFTSVSGQELIEPEWSYSVESARLFARGLFPSHQGTIMKRELVNELGGFDISYQITSDYHLMLKAHQIASAKLINFPIANFQQGGVSSQYWRHAVTEFRRARVSVFNPRGIMRLREWSDTTRGFAKISLARLIRRKSSD